MALKIYGQFTGETQGEVKGGATREDNSDWVEILSLKNGCDVGFDNEVGRITGRRRHRPLELITPISKASPLFWAMCVNNENLTDIVIQWYRPNSTGTEEQFYTTEIHNAQIVSVEDVLPDVTDPEQVPIQPLQKLKIAYQHIIWTFTDGGITGEDNVDASRA